MNPQGYFSKYSRKFSTEANSTAATSAATSAGAATRAPSRHITIEYWRKSPIFRATMIAYGIGAFGHFMTSTCLDGLAALRKYDKIIENGTAEGRFNAVKRGCVENSLDNFFDSIFFPWNVATSLMPHAIIWIAGK